MRLVRCPRSLGGQSGLAVGLLQEFQNSTALGRGHQGQRPFQNRGRLRGLLLGQVLASRPAQRRRRRPRIAQPTGP